MDVNKIYNDNCLTGLKKLPDNSIDCCITSPPYYGLRDYGTANYEGGNIDCEHTISGYNDNLKPNVNRVERNTDKRFACIKCGAIRIDEQIGLEETPELYVSKIVEVFTEVKRVLKKEGTLWLNLGDSYWGGKGQSGSRGNEFQERRNENGESLNKGYQTLGGAKETRPTDRRHETIKPKDLIGIPWMVAFALRSSGWYLRQDIIWSKQNCMPESVRDRCTKSHEYIFLLSKSAKYYFDNEAIKTKMDCPEHDKRTRESRKRAPTNIINGIRSGNETVYEYANKRSVWETTLTPFPEAHFATFPQDLIIDCIKAGCPENGIILDPFMGAGTTAVVAKKLARNYIGFELNDDYIKIAEKRLYKEIGMFL